MTHSWKLVYALNNSSTEGNYRQRDQGFPTARVITSSKKPNTTIEDGYSDRESIYKSYLQSDHEQPISIIPNQNIDLSGGSCLYTS